MSKVLGIFKQSIGGADDKDTFRIEFDGDDCPELKEALPFLIPSMFAIVAGQISHPRFETQELPCLRVSLQGTRTVLCLNALEVIRFLIVTGFPNASLKDLVARYAVLYRLYWIQDTRVLHGLRRLRIGCVLVSIRTFCVLSIPLAYPSALFVYWKDVLRIGLRRVLCVLRIGPL